MFAKKDDDKPICPLMKGECIKAKCMFWTRVVGVSPQTKADVDLHDCAVRWLPVLIIENSQQQRQTGAAVESLRNENVTTGQQIASALMHVAAANGKQLLKGD